MLTAKRKSVTVCLTAAAILICYLVQTTDCLRLKKTERRVSLRDTDASTGVQEGKVVFEDVFEEPQVTDGTRKAPLNASVDDEAAYQADFPGWSAVNTDDATSKEKWNRLATSLHCFGDHMKFRSLGHGASQFSVAQENKPPLPVSMIPQKCGYNMHGNSMILVMMVPYDGCNVVQQGGSYKLPMNWQGKPVSLLCPRHVTATAPNLHHYWPPKYYEHQAHGAPQVPQGHGVPQVPQVPQGHGVPQVPQVPHGHGVPQVPQVPQVPHGHGVHQVPHGHGVHQVPQVPHGHGVPQVPHGHGVLQVPQVPHGHGVLQVPQVPHGHGVLQVPQVPHGHGVLQVPQVPHGHGVPQVPQVPQVPHGHSVLQVPQVPHGHGVPQVPHGHGVPQVPQVPQVPHGHSVPQVPQVVMVPPGHPLPQFNFLSHPSHLYDVSSEHGRNLPELPKFSSYPQQPFLFLPPASFSTAEPMTTSVPKVNLPQIPFHPHFPWSQFPNFMPPLHHPIPQQHYQEARGPENKPTVTPTTSQADVPLHFYSHEQLPFSYEHIPYAQLYNSLRG